MYANYEGIFMREFKWSQKILFLGWLIDWLIGV